MSDDEHTDLRGWLEDIIDLDGYAGLYEESATRDAVLTMIDEQLGERPTALVELLSARIRDRFAARAREELAWTDRTDNDRLEAAFAQLSARGVFVGQVFGETIQEGAALIDAIIVERGLDVRGSVFFHRQDLQRAIVGEGLSLAFTAYEDDGGAASIAIGREIVDTLARHGLRAEWDGTREKRPRITPFVWRRRRVTKAPAGGPVAPPVVATATAPAIAPAACPRCNGRGWTQSSPSAFPTMCDCKRV